MVYKIVMIRHGESAWNKENRFCGWFDADLSEKGKISLKSPSRSCHWNVLYPKCATLSYRH